MAITIKQVKNNHQTGNKPKILDAFSLDKVQSVKNFQETVTNYQVTPLVDQSHLAKEWHIGQLFIKDESPRFGLKAFKGLGAVYAVSKYYAERLGLNIDDVTFPELQEAVKTLESVTFTSVTAGNHGKGIAWAASLFGQSAKIFMPKGTAQSRLDAVRQLGAESYKSDQNYDDTMLWLADKAHEEGWILIQDTAWKDYEAAPLAIMQGYSTIISEIVNQMGRSAFDEITDVILQAGVGSFASAMIAAIHAYRGDKMPVIHIVEPDQADCLYQSAKSSDGLPHRVHGDLASMMAGLACGEPSPIAWNIIKEYAYDFYSCSDDVAALGMKILAHPQTGDQVIVSGESGALPIGVLANTETRIKDLDLGPNSRVLVISTEGDTNPSNYRQIVSHA